MIWFQDWLPCGILRLLDMTPTVPHDVLMRSAESAESAGSFRRWRAVGYGWWAGSASTNDMLI